jgi:type III restriction enzyme
LLQSGRIQDVFNNPEEFISNATAIIKDQRTKMEINTVKYHKLNLAYQDDIFQTEVPSYKTNIVEAARSLYDKVICDNSSEQQFAKDLANDEQVTVFCKLPQNYYVGTPAGNYRPDWAIIYQRKRVSGEVEKRLFLVRETKFGYSAIRGIKKSIPQDEQDKIDCATKHFDEIGDIDFRTAMSYDDFKLNLPQ